MNAKKQSDLIHPIKKYWYLLAINLVMSVVLTQVKVDGTNRIAQVTDALFNGQEIILKEVLPPFILLTLIGTAVAFAKSYTKNTFSIYVQTEIKNITTAKLVKLQYQYFDETGTGSIMNKLIADIYQIESLFSEVLPEMMMSIIMILCIGVYICITDYRLCLVTFVCYPILLMIANKLSKSMGRLTGNRRALYDEMENTALDTFNGMIVGRSFHLNKQLQERSYHIIDRILKNEYIRTRTNSCSQTIGMIGTWLPRVVCYLFALYEVFRGRLSLGTMLAFAMLLDNIVHPFSELPSYFNALREQMVSFRRIEQIVKQPEEKSGEGTFLPDHKAPAIELEHIHFGYDDERTIFDDFSISIPEGQNVALVGSSGGGKSTVFKIICGFYVPESGVYRLFGHEYSQWNIAVLRKQFALVSQNVFLFPGSIAENIAYGREGATKEDVIDACKKANIHDFIMGLPQGYETGVGERGVKLSGGQRQRISIARAFLKRAPILMLDEPTSAVDVETEELIQDAIRNISVGKTVITIAHRLSTIENADQIFVFSQGKIVEHGTHEELLHAHGVYQNLYSEENQLMKEGGNVDGQSTK